MPRIAAAAALLSLLCSLSLSCGGAPPQPASATPPPPAASADPDPQTDPPPPAPVATIAEPAPTSAPPPGDPARQPPKVVGSGSGDSTGRACSVTDSNGPEAGGERTDSCPDGERCVCDRQAGYSCAGTCHISRH